MDEECQKTKEGERMKTKSQEVVERTEEERVLKKTQTWWLTGGDSRRGQCTQTWTAGTCSEGNIKCYKGGGVFDNASTHESCLAPGPEVLCS